MKKEILTYSLLKRLVEFDTRNHQLNNIAILFLNGMSHWPPENKEKIINIFISNLEKYYQGPLTIENILNKKFIVNSKNILRQRAGNYIAEVIEKSNLFYKEVDFRKIVVKILGYYCKQIIFLI